MAIVTSQSCLRVERSLNLTEITDGPENTVMVFEAPVTQAVPWMSPVDADVETFLSTNNKTKTIHPEGTHVLLADGRTRFLPSSVSSEVRRALITAANDDNKIFSPQDCQIQRPVADDSVVLTSNFKPRHGTATQEFVINQLVSIFQMNPLQPRFKL